MSKLLDEQLWEVLFSHCTRLWDGNRKEGLTKRQWINRGLDPSKITHILIRNDSWVIGCEHKDYQECFELWKNDWKLITHKNNI